MSVVMKMLAEILDGSPQIRPDSPTIRPDDFEDISELSPDSPRSPSIKLESPKLIEWCAGLDCTEFEEIDLPRKGITPGCIHRESDYEMWRRLDQMTACPNSHCEPEG